MVESIASLWEEYGTTLDEFARRHGLTLSYTAEERGWSDPHVHLGWVNPQGHLCDMYLSHIRDVTFRVRVICWGLHDEIGRRDWDLNPRQGSLTGSLLEAKKWGDLLQ